MLNAGICHGCEFRSCAGKGKPKCNGDMLCTVSGKNVLELSAAGNCPKGYFTKPDPTEFKPAKPRTLLPLHPDNWPAWAKLVAAMKVDGEKGVGSTIERKLGLIGAAFKLTLKALGVPCSCADRKELFDKLYPYP
jgi:hypothetical protein